MSTEQAADPQKAANAALGKFFELNKQGYSRCLHYNMDCKKDAIRAHSIQNNKLLDLIQRDNHLIVPKNKITAGKATAEFGPLGRNQASTFTGLCAEHDTELFKLADTLPLDTGNKEQLNQYAYRAGMREMHACVEAGGLPNPIRQMSRGSPLLSSRCGHGEFSGTGPSTSTNRYWQEPSRRSNTT